MVGKKKRWEAEAEPGNDMTEKKYFQKLCVEHTNKEHRGLVAAFQGRDDESG